MCGIVGAMSHYLSDPEIERFKELMIVSNLRGKQGAGVICVSQNLQVDYLKSLGNGIDVCEDDDFRAFVKAKSRPSILIGHTRLPTKGGVNLDTTHPHDVGNIIGVHNGTMETVMGKSIPAGESDSLLLYQAIQEHGIEKAIAESRGAYALVWVNIEDNSLNVLRNSKRPLFAAVCPHSSTVYWASEYSMLGLVLNRAGVKAEIKSVPEDVLHTFDLHLNPKIKERKTKFVKGPEVPFYSPFQGATTERTGTTTTTGGGTPSNVVPFDATKSAGGKLIVENVEAELRKIAAEQSEKEQKEALSLKNKARGKQPRVWKDGEDNTDDYKETIRGYHVHKNVFDKLVDQGCAYCGTIPYGDSLDKLVWFARHEFVCNECKDDDWVQEFIGDQKKAASVH